MLVLLGGLGVVTRIAADLSAPMLSTRWEEEMKAQGVDIEAEDAPEPRLVLQVRLFTQSMLDSSDTVLVRLQYIQAVYSVIATLYQLDLELCIKLAGLQLYSKFGKFNPEVCVSRRGACLPRIVASLHRCVAITRCITDCSRSMTFAQAQGGLPSLHAVGVHPWHTHPQAQA